MSILGKQKSQARDSKPYIEVKDAIVARSGIYMYTYEEVLARGHRPAKVKDWYKEFRPAAVLVEAASLFNLVPVPNQEHTSVDIDEKNFRTLASGMVGGPIEVVPMPNGLDIGLRGKIAFFTKEAYDYYMAGNKETSADYTSESVLVDNPEELGYDLLMTKIVSVNNVAITARGRGGKDVRVQDSVLPGQMIDRLIGRKEMGVLQSFLKLGKPQTEKFSATVKDALGKLHDADPSAREKIASAVIDQVAEFSGSDARSALLGAVRDAFVYPDAVLAKWSETERVLDGLHARCVDADAALAAQVADSTEDKKEMKKEEKEEGEEKEEEEEEKKKAKAKDSFAAALDNRISTVDGRISGLEKSLPGIVESAVKAALGLEGAPAKGARAIDSMPMILGDDQDASFAIKGAFGSAQSKF